MSAYQSYGSRNKPLICFFHGFLGSAKDFLPIIQELQTDFWCISFDIPAHGKSCYAPKILKSLQKTIESFSSKPLLIGYSMGGRISLMLSEKIPVHGVIALSSHVGLDSLEDKHLRLQQDFLWIHRLNTLPPQEFLALWYQQPIFSSLHQKPQALQKLLSQRLYNNPQELALVLEELSLAKQPFFNTFRYPTCFLFGSQDKKYQELYLRLPPTVHVEKIQDSGHALLVENPSSCIHVLRKNIQRIFNLSKRENSALLTD